MKKNIFYTYLILSSSLILTYCNTGSNKEDTSHKKRAAEIVDDIDTRLSRLSLPIDYPTNKLADMMNRIMPDTLVSDTINMNSKGDYMILKLLPIGDLLLNGYQDNLDISIPLEALIYVKKRVLGLNIKNKKAVNCKLRLDAHLDLMIDENFDLASTCKVQKVHWIQTPSTDILGINIDLQNVIDKQIKKNSKIIEEAIANALNDVVPIKKEVEAIWRILNDAHRVAKKPIDIWLSTSPKNLSAFFDTNVTDTIRAILTTNASIAITPLNGLNIKDKTLPKNNGKHDVPTGLDLFVNVIMPYSDTQSILSDKLKQEKLTYQGVEIEIDEVVVSKRNGVLGLDLSFSNDIEAIIKAEMQPWLTDTKQLILSDISYSIESDNPLLSTIDAITHSSINEFIRENSIIELSHVLDSLDSKIIHALKKSNLGSKISLSLQFDAIKSDTILYYDNRLEWLFDVNGAAHAYLSDSLVTKNL